MLAINFSKVKNSRAPLLHLEQAVNLRPEFFARSKKMLLKADHARVKGDLFYQEPYVVGNFQVEADLVVPSSRSLKPVNFHEHFSFTENYTLTNPSREELAENPDPIVKVKDDLIDLQKAVEDNILLNIPTTILTKQERLNHIYPAGKNWAVISEKDFAAGKRNQINPAFAKLKSLLKDKEQADKKFKP